MSKLIITIGGTGSRSGNAAIFTMAANMSEAITGDLFVMSMDKDTQNGTTSKFNSVMDTYEELTKALGKVNERTFAKFDLDPNRKSWTMEGILGKAGSDTLESYCTPASRKFLQLFYTETERLMSLENGFERHPNIGSLVFEGIKANQNFVKKIDDVLKEGGRADIFIIGSIFGGTGASMFVNIAQYIRERAQTLKKVANVGGALLLPYFNIPLAPPEEQKNDPVTDDDLNEATQTALGYYESIKNLVRGGETGCEAGNAIFDALYVSGLDPRCRLTHEKDKAIYAKGGSSQDSECNVVDLLVASALCHFFDAADGKNKDLEVVSGETNQNLFVATLSKNSEAELDKIGWNNLPGNTVKLKDLLCFSIAICGIYYPDFRLAKKTKHALYCRCWKDGKKGSPHILASLHEFCCACLEFIFQIASTYADGQPICDLVDTGKLEKFLAFAKQTSYTEQQAIDWREKLPSILGTHLAFDFTALLDSLNCKYDRKKADTEIKLVNEIYNACQTN